MSGEARKGFWNQAKIMEVLWREKLKRDEEAEAAKTAWMETLRALLAQPLHRNRKHKPAARAGD
jgi:hypothetical protein